MIPTEETNVKFRVLVTGASGYVALHCVQQLLNAGYTVRGTVRSLTNAGKVGPLRKMRGADERLELVVADLERPDDWPSVIKDCDYILHVASPWPVVADESTVDTAVNGTMNVLRAAADEPRIRKIVMTSSCAAINDGHKNKSRIFDETCWTNLESKKVEFYARSKTLAERMAWEFWNTLPEKERFQLTVLNPVYVCGPVLSEQTHGSSMLIERMMDIHTFLAVPAISIGVVDVRDVARAHVRAMTTSACDGQRILITAQPSLWFADFISVLKKEFKPQGYTITPFRTPKWSYIMYNRIARDKESTALENRVGPELRFDNSKSKALLNMSYIDPRQSILDMAYSMIENGMIKKKSGYKGVPDYVRLADCDDRKITEAA